MLKSEMVSDALVLMYTPPCEASKQCAFECLWQRPIFPTQVPPAMKPEGFASISRQKGEDALFMHASHAPSRQGFTSCTTFLCQTATSSVHHAAAPDVRRTSCVWLSTLHINMPSIDYQCHVMPSGLKKYGWEAHDGKSYRRQELYDEHFHLTTSGVSVCVAYLPTTHC